MAIAAQEARRLKHYYIGTEHILLGLLMEKTGLGANILKSLGVDLDEARQMILALLTEPEEPANLGVQTGEELYKVGQKWRRLPAGLRPETLERMRKAFGWE
jgi:ATP-dependent Clp protease ATP-binding subunit ClpC